MFGNDNNRAPGPAPVQAQQFNNNFSNSPPSENFGKTRILNEIQEQIKRNFDEELTKLRSEMNSRQKELRKQMESLKSEAEKAMNERNEANEELRRMKELLDKKKEQESYHK